jgi:hypothetical protein
MKSLAINTTHGFLGQNARAQTDMPRFPDDAALVDEVKCEVERRLRLLTRRDWTAEVVTRKQGRHIAVCADRPHTILLSESSIRRLGAKKFYRAHKKMDPLLLTKEGLITDAVTKAIQGAFNLRKAGPGETWELRCPDCHGPCVVSAHRCILKQCMQCGSWFARDALVR